ncbi:uncharacterized protein A4U43_C01F23560 [Asparagus officinalis]|uniref:Uncharacterized protein n=1 Tax=Asparagus officinalis TaxID=4686 RepID=A0A5P1FRK2_ASPOF|nr:uncharacterized protein A4U43_C01F23560 [Asparagus officinalis]
MMEAGEGGVGSGNALEMEMLGFQQQTGEGEMEDLKPVIDVFDVTGGDEVKEEEEVVMVKAVAGEGNGFCFSTKTIELKDEASTIEHVQEHDLKVAASLFTLTNRNTSSL